MAGEEARYQELQFLPTTPCGVCSEPTRMSTRCWCKECGFHICHTCERPHSMFTTSNHEMGESPKCGGGCEKHCGTQTDKWCLVCECWLCEQCLRTHSSLPISKGHPVTDRQPTKSNPTGESRTTGSSSPGQSRQIGSRQNDESRLAGSSPSGSPLTVPPGPIQFTARLTVDLGGNSWVKNRYSREEALLSRLPCCLRVDRTASDWLYIWIVGDRQGKLGCQWMAKIKAMVSLVHPVDVSKIQTHTRTDTLTNDSNESVGMGYWPNIQVLKANGFVPKDTLTFDLSLELLDSRGF